MGPCDFIHKKEMITSPLFPEYRHIQSAEHSKARHPTGLPLLQQDDLAKNCEHIVLKQIFGMIKFIQADPISSEQ